MRQISPVGVRKLTNKPTYGLFRPLSFNLDASPSSGNRIRTHGHTIFGL